MTTVAGGGRRWCTYSVRTLVFVVNQDQGGEPLRPLRSLSARPGRKGRDGPDCTVERRRGRRARAGRRAVSSVAGRTGRPAGADGRKGGTFGGCRPFGLPDQAAGGHGGIRTHVTRFAGEPLNHSGTRPFIDPVSRARWNDRTAGTPRNPRKSRRPQRDCHTAFMKEVVPARDTLRWRAAASGHRCRRAARRRCGERVSGGDRGDRGRAAETRRERGVSSIPPGKELVPSVP
jgi:hypothetical protein